jgi:hypothetical protein
MDKILELLKLFEKFGIKPGKIIGTGDRKITPIKKPILSKTLNRGYLDEDVQAGKISNQTVKNEIEDLAPLFFSKQLNDVEINNAINNLNYLDNLLNPTNIIDITTKQPVKGLESLKAPTSIASELESAGKNLEKKAGELKGIVDEKPKSIIGDIMKDYGQFQKVMQDEKRKGLVRATARSILYDDIKSGKIKSMTLEDLGSLREPIDPFRKMYGEEALEQLDSLTDEFGQMRTAQEAAELAKSRFKLEPSDIKPEGSISIDEAKKGEQEFGINKPKETEVTNITSRIYKDADPDELIVEYNKNNQRLSLTDEEGGTLISYDEFNKLNKRNREIENILESLNVTPVLDDIKPEGIVIPFKKKITEPEEKAEGGIIRTKFAAGGKGKKILDIINKANKKLKGKKSMETVNPKTGEVTVPEEPVRTIMDPEPITQRYDQDMIKAANEIFPNYDDPKIAADQIAESYSQIKLGKNYEDLTSQEQASIYRQAYDYVMDRKKPKEINDKPIPGAFSFNDPEIKAGMEEAMQEAKKRGDEMRAIGLDPASGRDYDKYIEIKTKSGDKDFNKYFEDLEIKTKFKGVISDDLLQKILMDDDPQRKAEVIATIEQGLTMQEKGMRAEEIVDILKNAPRTKQAEGGIAGLL